jgi:hypothetical protein
MARDEPGKKSTKVQVKRGRAVETWSSRTQVTLSATTQGRTQKFNSERFKCVSRVIFVDASGGL